MIATVTYAYGKRGPITSTVTVPDEYQLDGYIDWSFSSAVEHVISGMRTELGWDFEDLTELSIKFSKSLEIEE